MADTEAALRDWSTTLGSNKPTDTTTIGTGLADNLQQIQATVRQYLASTGSNMASASTVNLANADGFHVHVTGTTTVSGLGTVAAGIMHYLEFDGALQLTHSDPGLDLPGDANITTAAGDCGLFISEGSGNWKCLFFTPADGNPPSFSDLLASDNTWTGNQTYNGTDTFNGGVTFEGNLTMNGTDTHNGDLTLNTVTLSGAITGGDQTVSAINLQDTGLITSALGASGGGNLTCNLNNGNSFTGTISGGNCTFTFSNPTASDECCGFVLHLTNGGSQTVTWPASVDWEGGTAPTLTSSGVDILTFLTWDGGTTWHGSSYSLDSK